MKKKSPGFTLIEILVALSIFGILSIGAYTVLDAGMRSKQITELRLDKLEAIQKTIQTIEKDLRMLSLRQVRDEFGDKIPLFRGQGELSGQRGFFELTRSDWRNPAGLPRSNLQHVIYHFENGILSRQHSIFLDQTTNSPKVVRTLLEDIDSLSLSFLDDHKQWQNNWGTFGAIGDDMPLPKAILIKIKFEPFGLIERLITITAGQGPKKQSVKVSKNS